MPRTAPASKRTEQIAIQALDFIKEEVGPDNVELSVGYVGLIGSSYPINNIFLWTRGPEEAVLRVALKPGSGVRVEELKHRLREKLPQRLGEWLEGQLRAEGLPAELVSQRVQGLRFSFEPADVVNEVMSFGSPTPIEVAVSGPDFAETRAYAEKVKAQLALIPSLRDLQFAQSLDYPTVEVRVDRELAGKSQADGSGREQIVGGGDVVEPLRGADLLGRSQNGHRLLRAGASAALQDEVGGRGRQGVDQGEDGPAADGARRGPGPRGHAARGIRPL